MTVATPNRNFGCLLTNLDKVSQLGVSCFSTSRRKRKLQRWVSEQNNNKMNTTKWILDKGRVWETGGRGFYLRTVPQRVCIWKLLSQWVPSYRMNYNIDRSPIACINATVAWKVSVGPSLDYCQPFCFPPREWVYLCVPVWLSVSLFLCTRDGENFKSSHEKGYCVG